RTRTPRRPRAGRVTHGRSERRCAADTGALAPDAAPRRGHGGGPFQLRHGVHDVDRAPGRWRRRKGVAVNVMASVAERLRRPDMIQVLVALFAALAFVLAVRWPSGGSTVNEAWFSLAPARSALLAVIAAGFGAVMGAASRPRPVRDTDEPRPEWSAEAIATLGAIAALAAITTPFEAATHAASFPSVNVVWTLASPLLTVTAFYGLGMALGWLGRALRVSMLIPVLVV